MRRVPFACLLWLVCCSANAAVDRIVSLAPNLTELAFSAGAGAFVVGTVEYSDEPAAAKKIPRVGDAFRVDVERILSLKPDVVLAWNSGTPQATIERLRKLGLTVRDFQTQRLDDVPRVVRELGQMAGTSSVAAKAAADFERSMAELRKRYGDQRSLRVFLQVSSRPLYTVNGRQLMSELVTLCGARNVFDDLGQLAPQVSLEAVIARDPEVIVVTDDADPSAAKEWQKWQQVSAVRANNVYTLPANDLTRATTRLSTGAAALCRVLETARAKGTKRL